MLKDRIKATEELALRAITRTKEIRTRAEIAAEKHNGVWSAEDREEFDRANNDFAQYHQTLEQLKAQLKLSEDLDSAAEGYEQPRETFEHRGVEPEDHAPRDPQESRQTQSARTPKELAERRRHREAFRMFLKHGEAGLSLEERQKYMAGPTEQLALVSNIDDLGGFLVPDDISAELIKDIAGFAVMRPICRVRSTVRQVMTFMTVTSGTDPYSSGVSGSWRQEGDIQGGVAIPTQNQPTFGRERVPTHIWRPDVIELTQDLIQDSAIDLETELRMLLAEVKALDEDSAFILGNGVGQPQGINTWAAITTVDSGSDTGWVYSSAGGGIIQLYTSLPAQYRSRATWLMNSVTYGVLLSITVASATVPLFPPNTLPSTLLQRPMVFSEFMPDGDTDTNRSIVWGDFSYYGIVDRRDLRVQRLIERYAPNVGILATARTGGQPLKAGPFRIGVTHLA